MVENGFRGGRVINVFGLHWTTSGTHHSVVSALMSGQAAQLDFT